MTQSPVHSISFKSLRIAKLITLLLILSSLSGCFYWIRAYQTYLQMDDFDEHFSISVTDEFSINFKAPILYSEDFITLSKLHPSLSEDRSSGKKWRYWFRKVNEQGQIVIPEIKFYFDLSFNKEQRLTRWSFSQLFLQIAPAEFLEVSLRSIGGAKINKVSRQLKANTDLIKKISAELPKKQNVLSQLGQPLAVEDQEQVEIYRYHFKLETAEIKKGYEERALSVLRLTFDKTTNELIKMSGRFAGLKISINYRKLQKKQTQQMVFVKTQQVG